MSSFFFKGEDMNCYHCKKQNRDAATHCQQCGKQINWHGWRIDKKLGEGGMGTAYLVIKKGEQAVLKVPLTPDPESHLTECRNLYAAASYGVGPRPIMTSPSGIVMEYIPVRTGTLTESLIFQFLKNVNMMHNRQMIHRDLKPENIIGWKPIDFGSAVLLPLDLSPNPIGTPGYAAPEAYNGIVGKSLDAYGAGWVMVNWLGGPDPNPAKFGPPANWTPPNQWGKIINGLLDPDSKTRLSVGGAYNQLVGQWCDLVSGASIGSDLVTASEWRKITGKSCENTCDYATNLSEVDINLFLKKTNTRLPTKAELIELAKGTQEEKSWGTHPAQAQKGLTSDIGARSCRKLLWQPTSDGWLWGGTPYAKISEIRQVYQANPMIGLRVVRN